MLLYNTIEFCLLGVLLLYSMIRVLQTFYPTIAVKWKYYLYHPAKNRPSSHSESPKKACIIGCPTCKGCALATLRHATQDKK